MDFPQIKKKIAKYLLGEEGKISKQSLLTVGTILGAAAVIESQNVSASLIEGHSMVPCANGYQAPCGYLSEASSQADSACGATNCCHANALTPIGYAQATQQMTISHSHVIHHCNY